jgi:BON domain
MIVRPVYAASLMIVSLAAAATTFSTMPDTYFDPLAIVDTDNEVIAQSDTLPADETPLAPSTDEAQAPVPAAATEANPPYTEPPITVTISPQDRDTLINKDVMDALANEPNLSGKIGVETNNQVVTLSGRVGTTGQVDRAGRIARGVTDVNEVQNLLHARVGG